MAAARTDRCLQTIDDYKKQQFGELEYRKELDENELTSVWKNPERLSEKDDYCLLFHVLSHGISNGNYEETLIAFKKMGESDKEEDIHRLIAEMFSSLMLQILREERRKKIDSHVVLEWLECGDRLFPEQGVLTRKSYAVLKLYYLCKTWKSKYECSSCGCIQKQIIDLFLENGCCRLNEALHTIIKLQNSDFHPTLRRIFKSISDVRPIEFFTYYIEILQELDQCNVIDVEDEKAPARLIQLIGLVCEMKSEDVPEACSRLYRLLTLSRDLEKKQSAAIETVMKSRLIPKIFDSLMSTESVKIENFNSDSMRKFVDLIEKEEYSHAMQATILFAPLQLLNLLCEKWDVWKKSRPVITSKIESLTLSSSSAPIIVLYLLNFIYRIDSSLLENFAKSFERRYSKSSSEQKSTILLIFDILEQLANSNQSIASFLKANRVKTNLLLTTDLDSPSNFDLVLQYLPDLTPSEFNHFVQSKSSSFSEESWNDLFRFMKDRIAYVAADEVWRFAVERNCNRDAISFIRNQLKGLLEKKDRKTLMQRLGQMFKQLRTLSPTSKLPPQHLLLAVPELLLSLSPEEYSLLPQNTTNSLIPVLILAYCFIFDRNVDQITNLFRALMSKIRKTENVFSDDNPIQVLEEICEVIRIGKSCSCDISFVKQTTCGGVETFVKTLSDAILLDSLRNTFPSNETMFRVKERIADVSSVLLGRLAPQLQALGDRGQTPFCQLATIVDKYISGSKNIGRICERSIDGFVCMTVKWNGLFVVPRVLKILTSVRDQSDLKDLLEELIRKIRKNEVLLGQLEKKKEFIQFERI